MATGRRITRRAFIQGAAAATAAGVGARVVLRRGPDRARTIAGRNALARAADPAGSPAASTGLASSSEPALYFFSAEQAATARAICSRIVPSTNPITGAEAPGATEAMAFVYIDRFLAAFALPDDVADNPAIYLHGPFSGRNPYGDDATGEPSSQYPTDSFLSPDGQAHFVELTDLQALSWRSSLVGPAEAMASAPSFVSKSWAAQVASGTIPAPPDGGLQLIYSEGLAAFDDYSESLFGVPFAGASTEEQDLMLQAAGNVVASQAPLPSPPGAPSAAKTLFPYMVVNTFQGCYGLPEYRWVSGEGSTSIWEEIGWDGDTQPLGNTIYDENLFGPGQGPNAGFGDPDVYLPRGGFREYRPVSYLGDEGDVITELDLAALVSAFDRAGVTSTSLGARSQASGASGPGAAATTAVNSADIATGSRAVTGAGGGNAAGAGGGPATTGPAGPPGPPVGAALGSAGSTAGSVVPGASRAGSGTRSGAPSGNGTSSSPLGGAK